MESKDKHLYKEDSTVDVAEDLCHLCRNLFSGKKEISWWYPVNYPFHKLVALQSSRQEKCRFCRFVKNALEAPRYRQFLARAHISAPGEHDGDVVFDTGREDVIYDMTITFSAGNTLEFVLIAVVPSPELDPNGQSSIRQQHKPACMSPSITSSADGLDTALSWLDTCIDTHSACSQSYTSSRRLPTRLIRIEDYGINLCNTDTLPLSTVYVTLSHCWGKAPAKVLTKESLFEFSNGGLLIDELPLTFQHAISVTRVLRVSYIWIDSLCIIQDCREDWQRESSLMWEVYNNSLCNISATASSDSHGGLYCVRDLASISPCEVPASWDGIQKGVYHCIDQFEWVYEVAKAPVNQRAWVLQERFLAPRILHFGAHQLYWECKELSASEIYPRGLPRAMREVEIKRGWDLQKLDREDGTPIDCYEVWADCVEEYSRCNLTFPSDKLVALSGIAKVIHQRQGGQDIYLAGLWKSRLIWHLFWLVKTDSRPGSRMKTYRAPTWSWASLDREITFQNERKFPKKTTTVLATIFDVSVKQESDCAPESSFGQVVGGMVQLRGPLFRVKLKRGTQFKNGDEIKPAIALRGSRNDSFEAQVFLDEGIYPDQDLDFHFLVLYAHPGGGGQNRTEGLLLLPTNKMTPKIKGDFERFAAVSVDSDEFYKVVMLRNEHIDTEIEFEEDNGNGEYTITII